MNRSEIIWNRKNIEGVNSINFHKIFEEHALNNVDLIKSSNFFSWSYFFATTLIIICAYLIYKIGRYIQSW